MKKNKMGFTIIMCLLLIVVTIGVTYAAFTFSKEGTVENTLETGTIVLTYTEGKTGITLNEAYPMSDEQGKLLIGENNVFDFTVQANLSRKVPIGYEVAAVKIPITDMTPLEDNEVKLYLERAIDPDTTYQEILAPTHFIPRDEQSEIGSPIGSMIIDSGTFINQGVTIHNYRLRIWVDENTQIPSGESRKYGIRINVYAKQDVLATPVEQEKPNQFIMAVYQYDQTAGSDTFCVTGEETTCVDLKKTIDIYEHTYEIGTIIKYKVNDTLEKYFHVLKDNGDTLTLQQRENTISAASWTSSGIDTGPINVLSFLEQETNSWVNVLDQTYALGTTVFKDNAYTGCSYSGNVASCTTNVYTLEERTAKARMITLQEATGLGCNGSNQSCPVWMYNYLQKSISFGGTVNAGTVGYWTSSAGLSNLIWNIHYAGHWGLDASTYPHAARAVVVISKLK